MRVCMRHLQGCTRSHGRMTGRQQGVPKEPPVLPSFSPAILALADGTVFRGHSIGASGHTIGEVVFNTAITGYQEILTDPSYAQQIVTLTYPHIGNVGVNAEDVESTKVHAAGLIIRDLPVLASNFRSEQSLADYLKAENVVAISNIDTRKLTRILRDKGAQNGCIMVGEGAEAEARLARVDGVKLARIALAELRDRFDMTVGIAVWGNQGPTVVHWMESSHPAKAALKLGDVMPLLSSATGLLFAACLPRSKTQVMLDRELAATRQSMADVEPLLADIRAHGASRVEGMLLPGIHAFCMPVFDSTGDLALGLIALGHEGSFDTRWGGGIDTALRECAGQLSYELGYKPGER